MSACGHEFPEGEKCLTCAITDFYANFARALLSAMLRPR